jgi:hydrogenase maturation factor
MYECKVSTLAGYAKSTKYKFQGVRQDTDLGDIRKHGDFIKLHVSFILYRKKLI